jgi:hypothetical protein
MRRFGRIIAAMAAFGFGYIAFLYLTLPDVRELRTKNLESTAFMRLRARIDLAEIRKALESGESVTSMRGASTITQQLAKNLYLSPTRNPFRKLTELLITRRLEHELSKTRIFELYLNNIEWGDGIWGAEAAARAYFGIPASAIGPDQAAIMAGAIINPRVLNIAKPNARLRGRQRIIRARMGKITPPPVIARPAPAEVPAFAPDGATADKPAPPEYEPEEEATPEPPAETAPDAAPIAPEPAPVAPEAAPNAPVAPESAPSAPGAPG